MSVAAAGGTAVVRPPFFIVGADRSGTTLLRLYLNAHSRLAVPSESWFLSDLFAAFGPRATLDGDDLRRALRIVAEHPRFQDGWDVYLPALQDELEALAPVSLATLCDRLFRRQTRADDDTRWGDKTPEYVEHLADLDRCFDGAHYIHLLRDGRDVYLSLAKRRWSDRGYTPHELGRYWSRCVAAAARAGDALGPRLLEVRYENLVLATEATLQRITDFLGVAYEPAMREAHREAAAIITQSEEQQGVHEKLLRAPRPSDVARWRRAEPGSGLRLAAAVMEPELRQSGYEDVPSPGAARVLRPLARLDHLWRRRTRPRLRRVVRGVAARLGSVR